MNGVHEEVSDEEDDEILAEKAFLKEVILEALQEFFEKKVFKTVKSQEPKSSHCGHICSQT